MFRGGGHKMGWGLKFLKISIINIFVAIPNIGYFISVHAEFGHIFSGWGIKPCLQVMRES